MKAGWTSYSSNAFPSVGKPAPHGVFPAAEAQTANPLPERIKLKSK